MQFLIEGLFLGRVRLPVPKPISWRSGCDEVKGDSRRAAARRVSSTWESITVGDNPSVIK